MAGDEVALMTSGAIKDGGGEGTKTTNPTQIKEFIFYFYFPAA